MNLGECIKTARKKYGLTQKQLANSTGISLMSIRRYEANERQPNIDILAKIATALDVPISYFVESIEQVDLGYPADIKDNIDFFKNGGLEQVKEQSDKTLERLRLQGANEEQLSLVKKRMEDLIVGLDKFKSSIEELEEARNKAEFSLQSLLNEKQTLEKTENKLKILERLANVTKKINPLGLSTVIELLEGLAEPISENNRQAVLERFSAELQNYDPTDIAEAYGTYHPYDYLFEQKKITLQEAKKIADELGVTFDYLVGFTDDPSDELSPTIKILSLLSGLNTQGQKKVLDRIEELLEVPKYQKDYDLEPPAVKEK